MAREMPQYKKRLYIKLGFPVVLLVLCMIAWDSGIFNYWGLPLMAVGVYALWIVPTSCKAITMRKGQCTRGCYGLLKGCRYVSSHGPDKRADLLRALTAGRAQAIPSPAGGTTVLKSEPTPDPDAVTIDPTQRLVIVFTVVGGIAGVVQTVIAALSMH